MITEAENLSMAQALEKMFQDIEGVGEHPKLHDQLMREVFAISGEPFTRGGIVVRVAAEGLVTDCVLPVRKLSREEAAQAIVFEDTSVRELAIMVNALGGEHLLMAFDGSCDIYEIVWKH